MSFTRTLGSFLSSVNALYVLPQIAVANYSNVDQMCPWKVYYYCVILNRGSNPVMYTLTVRQNEYALSVLCTEGSVLCYVLYCALDTLPNHMCAVCV